MNESKHSELMPQELSAIAVDTARQIHALLDERRVSSSNRKADQLSALLLSVLRGGGEKLRSVFLLLEHPDHRVALEIAARMLGIVDESAELTLGNLTRIADRPTAHTASLLLDGWQTCFSKPYGVSKEAERLAILGIGPRQAFCDENPAIPLAWGSWGSKMDTFVDLRGSTTEQLVDHFCELSDARAQPQPGSQSSLERFEARMRILRFLGLQGRGAYLELTASLKDPRPEIRFSIALALLGVATDQAVQALEQLAEAKFMRGEGGPTWILKSWRNGPWKSHYLRFVEEDPHPADLHRAAKRVERAKRSD
jgi:hypothetical protein